MTDETAVEQTPSPVVPKDVMPQPRSFDDIEVVTSEGFVGIEGPMQGLGGEVFKVNPPQEIDPWDPNANGLNRPLFAVTRRARETFHRQFAQNLENRQRAFEKYVILPTGQAEELSRWAGQKVATVVRYDTFRDIRASALEEAFAIPLLAAIVACFTAPFALSHQWSWSCLGSGALGLIIAVVLCLLVAVILWIVDVMVARTVADSPVGYLISAAFFASALWLIILARPQVSEALVAALAASAALWTCVFLAQMSAAFTRVAIRRLKIFRDVEGEIIESLLGILYASFYPAETRPIARFSFAAEELQYVAWLVSENWHQLVPEMKGLRVRSGWHRTAIHVAAGLQELSIRAAFADEHYSDELSSKLSTELTAFVTGNYGDLLVGEPEELTAKPRAKRILRMMGSLLAALTPILGLLVVPAVLHIPLDEKLSATLITAALAWLVLFVVSWLDPKSMDHAKSVGSLISAIGGKPKTQ